MLDAAQRQSAIHHQYLILLLLLPLHGYYNFIRLYGWLDGTIGLLKETLTIVVVGQFCFNNYYASRDQKKSIAERNVRRVMHAANVIGTLYIAFGLIWGGYLLTTNARNTTNNENAFILMNDRLYPVALMIMGFVIRLFSLKPGISEFNFLKLNLRYPWRFIWPSKQNKTFGDGEDKH